MKKIFLLITFLGIAGYSQSLIRDRDIEIVNDSIYEMFSRLEANRIPNGLLLDAAVEFADLSKYNGTLPDSSYTSSKIVTDIYNTLVMSRLHESAVIKKTPEEFTNDWKSAQLPDIVPLGGVFYKYSQFSESTLQNAKNGAVVWDGTYLLDRYEKRRWINPYEEKYVFAIAPAVNSFNKLHFQIVLPDNLFLSNQADINRIEYKLADGRGTTYQVLPPNRLIDVRYPSTGEYHWTFKITLNSGEVLYSHTLFTIDGNLDKYETSPSTRLKSMSLGQYTKVEIDPFSVPGPFIWSSSVHKARATMYIQLASGHTQITKPLIVAEGFDMGCILSPSTEAGLSNIDKFINSVNPNEYETPLGQKLKTYDIIYVDWGNGVDYIQNNADLLKKAIRWVNNNKAGTEKNVVLGQSMGGLVARYALKDMEDKGENHDTQLFISHDAPHLGANIPLGLQDMLINISNTYIHSPILAGVGEFIVPVFNQGISFNDILTLAGTPAARQMLINYVNKSYNIDNSIHNNWQAELLAKGYPKQTRNVAISNGSECGTDQTSNELLRLYKETKEQYLFSDILGVLLGVATTRLDLVFLAALPGSSKYVFDFTVKPMLLLNANNQIYRGKITYKKKVLWFIPAQTSLLSGSKYQPSNVFPMDKYGGGKFNLNFEALPSFLAKDLVANPFSFIPTASALDYYSGKTALTEAAYQKSFSPVDDAANVPFANFVAEQMNENNTHISFSNRNGQFIINQLSTNINTQNQKITTSYLCGSKINIGGESVVCMNTQTYTTGFAPNILWSVTQGNNLINITSPMNEPQISFNPKSGANGLVSLRAVLSGDGASNTTTKDIWIGKPKIGVDYKPVGTNYVQVYLVGSDGSDITKQGITGTTWNKISNGGGCSSAFSGSSSSLGFLGIASGACSNWTLELKITATNACGTTTIQPTITPPLPLPCNNNHAMVKTSENKFAVMNIIGPCDKASSLKSGSVVPLWDGKAVSITVYDLSGNKMMEVKNNTVDLDGLKNGLYVIKAVVNNEIITQKIIKQ
ncbi:MAG: T9SS type A sorting domain-containing protein [Prevotellaceae bacterium]|jgi:hypothetical protein|nr:T9SS type A sorting domain-containing protein [Prevotellaceae bacterium]